MSEPWVVPGINGEPDLYITEPTKVVEGETKVKRKGGRPKKNPAERVTRDREKITKELPAVDVPLEEPLKRRYENANQHFRFLPVISAEKWWVDRAREDPGFFYEYMSGYPVSKHHRIWLANIFHPTRRRLNFIAPRESNKTSAAIYALAWLVGRAPLLTNCLISVSATIAEARLRMLHAIVGDNLRYRNVFPTVYIDKQLPDTQQEFTVASAMNNMPRNVWRSVVERQGSLKDATLYVAGAGGRGVIGRRFSGLLILDDIIDETYLKDELQEGMMEYIIRTLIPCVKFEGKVINIGTRWMIGDIPERLMNNPEWHTVQIKAIETDPNTGERRSYWPDYWTVDLLDKKKAEMNNDAMFNIMYMNDPTAMTAALFTHAQLAKGLPDPLPKLKAVYVGTDWAIAQTTHADFNVFVALGVDHDDNWYVLDMVRFKDNEDNVILRLGDFCDRIASTYNLLNAVIIEKIGFQALMQNTAARLRPDLPVIPHVPKGDKMHRGQYVKGLAQSNKLYINQTMPGINILKTEWMNFPLARHDDTLDAVSLVTQYVGGGISVRNTRTIRSPYLI